MQDLLEYQQVYIHGRSNLKTLVIYNDISSLEKTDNIENYYGFQNGVKGAELYSAGINQAKKLGIEVKNEEVIKIECNLKIFSITTVNNEYNSKVVIFATGNKKNTPNIKGIKEFEGKGVSYCAICDGFFYKDKNVVVIGSGNYAISEINDLINITKQITVLTNGEKAPEIRANNVKINEKEIKEIRGKNKVEEIEFKDNSNLKADGIFIAQGIAGSFEFAKKLGILMQNNAILVNEKMETNIPGIYACGDCTGGLLQISKAVYQGAIAGLEAIKYLKI
ncbi:MAG: NAD(P)/FAD-dependent oxidoreductase [Clostridia bacterium]|nr:NAD(P)/FAD-dependent oxidoreductase [Clostridia bacterium]